MYRKNWRKIVSENNKKKRKEDKSNEDEKIHFFDSESP